MTTLKVDSMLELSLRIYPESSICVDDSAQVKLDSVHVYPSLCLPCSQHRMDLGLC